MKIYFFLFLNISAFFSFAIRKHHKNRLLLASTDKKTETKEGDCEVFSPLKNPDQLAKENKVLGAFCSDNERDGFIYHQNSNKKLIGCCFDEQWPDPVEEPPTDSFFEKKSKNRKGVNDEDAPIEHIPEVIVEDKLGDEAQDIKNVTLCTSKDLSDKLPDPDLDHHCIEDSIYWGPIKDINSWDEGICCVDDDLYQKLLETQMNNKKQDLIEKDLNEEINGKEEEEDENEDPEADEEK